MRKLGGKNMNKKDLNQLREIIIGINETVDRLESDRSLLEKYNCRSHLLNEHIKELSSIKHQLVRLLVQES